MTNYGFDALRGIPEKMSPWGLQLEQPYPSDYGEYVLVEVAPADIELHHQVEVIDENKEPLRGVGVMFGFPGGNGDPGPAPATNHWRDSPSLIRGNFQVTNYAGYAQHTFQAGGEDIWVWDINEDGVLELPSPIVKNCKWVGTPVARFEHTGVKLRFQRRDNRVELRTDRVDRLESSVNELTEINRNLQSRIELHERKIANLENRYSELFRRVQLEAQRRSNYDDLMEGNE